MILYLYVGACQSACIYLSLNLDHLNSFLLKNRSCSSFSSCSLIDFDRVAAAVLGSIHRFALHSPLLTSLNNPHHIQIRTRSITIDGCGTVHDKEQGEAVPYFQSITWEKRW